MGTNFPEDSTKIKALENLSFERIKATAQEEDSNCKKIASEILSHNTAKADLPASPSGNNLLGKVSLSTLNLPPALYRELFKNNVTSSKERLEQEIELERAMTRNKEVWGIVEQRFFSFIQQLKEKGQ